MVGVVGIEDGAHHEDVDRQVKDNMELLMSQQSIDGVISPAARGEESGLSAPVTLSARQVTQKDLTDAYNRARRQLPDAVAEWYYKHLCDKQALDDDEAMARVAALSIQPSVIPAVEAAARDLIATWRNQYFSKFERTLSAATQEEFQSLWQPSLSDLVPCQIEIPESVRAATEKMTAARDGSGSRRTPTALPTYPKHLFTLPSHHGMAGLYPVALGSAWEQRVLNAELEYPTLCAWYRNPSNGKYALSIPYADGDKTGLLHPDFVFFHRLEEGDVRVDIVDPHQHQSSDTGPKWAGLARWAEANKALVRRAVAVIDVAGTLRSLSLMAPGIAERLDDASSKSQVEALFEELGVDY